MWTSRLGQYQKSIYYYHKALQSDLKTYDKDHPTVANRWSNIGLSYNSLGQYQKALYYFDKALQSDLKTYGKEHHIVAIRWNKCPFGKCA
jgi:tetratricopeptide (TPR) repeat protein